MQIKDVAIEYYLNTILNNLNKKQRVAFYTLVLENKVKEAWEYANGNIPNLDELVENSIKKGC